MSKKAIVWLGSVLTIVCGMDSVLAQSAQTAIQHPAATAAKRDTIGNDTVTGQTEGHRVIPSNPVGTRKPTHDRGPAARDAH